MLVWIMVFVLGVEGKSWHHGRRNGWLVLATLSLVLVVGRLLFWSDLSMERKLPSFKLLEVYKGGMNVNST